jgi:uncharacterized MAPEG superfamily protein
MAGLKQDELTTFVTRFLVVRIGYSIAYVTTSTQGPTFIRSGLWAWGLSLCLCIIVNPAAAMA